MRETSSPRHARSWEVDPLALRAAADLLDVRRPIRVQYTAQYRTLGKHGSSPDGDHLVRVSTFSSPEEASRTIWHELAHASQEERFSNRREFVTAYKAESATRGYRANSFEIEARTASDFAEDYPLVRKIGSIRLKSDPPRWYDEESV